MQPGQTVNTGLKQKMAKKDFFDAKEWVAVAKLDEIDAPGSTKAVAAGRAPGKLGASGFEEGAEFIWCLIRGEPSESDSSGEGGMQKVFAVDGACRACQFPMTAASWAREADGRNSLTCSCCGTKYCLEDGEVLEFMPKSNPVQWAAALANEKKGPQRAASLPTRISKSGRVYLRLPDNTLLQ